MNHTRIRTCIETEFEVGGRRAQGKIKNMSESGVFVGTTAMPETGENVDLSFRERGGNEITLSGLVWWTTNDTSGSGSRAPGFGLRLLDEIDDVQDLLARL
jgi:Tfp pilus assembly protein PilZ